MKIYKYIGLILILALVQNVQSAHAEEAGRTTLKLKSDDAVVSKDKDLDAEITDIKMRAESGAKSKVSMSLLFNYSGSSLHKPLDDKKPNIGDGRNPRPVSASGNLGARIRKNKNESFYLATGFSRSRPFSSRENDDKQIEINTPHAVYNNTFAFQDLQLSSSVRLYFSTLENERDIGQVASVGYSLGSVKQIMQTRLNAGASLNTWFNAFDKSEERLAPFQKDYGVSFMPTLQFKVNDRANIYSSWSIWNFSHYKSLSSLHFERSHVTQTIGTGVAIMRDFYLAPNISFYTSDVASKKTSVNLSATINL